MAPLRSRDEFYNDDKAALMALERTSETVRHEALEGQRIRTGEAIITM